MTGPEDQDLGAGRVVGPDQVARAVEVLRAGGLVAFPTETVYGLGADASNRASLARLYEVKGRPADHPVIVHLPDTAELDRWASSVPPAAARLAEAFWPGPLTLVLRAADGVADFVTAGRGTVGLRVPAHPLALELLRSFGAGVAAPSANRFGRVSPTTAAHVVDDLGSDVDLVLDGGPCEVGVESTILDLTVDPPEVLRPGGIPISLLEEVVGAPVSYWTGGRVVAAPGTLPAHYAPSARVEMVDDYGVLARCRVLAETMERGAAAIGVLAPEAVLGLPSGVADLGPAGPAERFASLLYGCLRRADQLGLEVLLVVPPPAEGIGVAVRDRLARAAAGGTGS